MRSNHLRCQQFDFGCWAHWAHCTCPFQDQKQKAVRELVLAHADAIEEPGYWVDLLDLMLLAEVRGKRLKFVIYGTQTPLRLVSAVDYSQGVSSGFQSRLSPSAPLWIVVLHNAKYVASDDFALLNHFAPAWGSDVVGFEKLWHSCLSNAEKEVSDSNQPTGLKGDCRGSADIDKVQHLEAAEKSQTALRKLQFVKDLKADLGLVTCDVPADGDCALWTVALADAGPNSSMAFDVEGWRERIAHSWRKFALQPSSGSMACFRDLVLCWPWENVAAQHSQIVDRGHPHKQDWRLWILSTALHLAIQNSSWSFCLVMRRQCVTARLCRRQA